jgi:hypothetical protein
VENEHSANYWVLNERLRAFLVNDAKRVFVCLLLYIFHASVLHMQYLLPTCGTVCLFVTNYCSDMFRPQFSVLASLLIYAAYGVTYAVKWILYISVSI